jgi:hypothetical protein
MIADFSLAACAEMIFTELPFERWVDDLGFQVEIWDWTRHDIESLRSTGAKGLPIKPLEVITGEMWLKAVHTLDRIAELGKRGGRYLLPREPQYRC